MAFFKVFLCLFLILYSVAVVVAGLLPIAIVWRVLLIILLSIYVVNGLLRYILLVLPSSFTALRKTSKSWLIYNQREGWQVIHLVPDGCVVLSWLIVLQFRLEGGKHCLTVCLPIDGMVTNDYRKLKVYLRY